MRKPGSVVAVALVVAGCLPEAREAPPPPPYLFPDVLHTGHDGASTFRVPVGTNMEGEVVWEVENGALASVEAIATPDNLAGVAATWVMVTTTGAGTTKVIATQGERRAEAMLVIEEYGATDVQTGDARYNDPLNPADPGRAACVGCHVEGGAASQVDHSPLSMTLHTDDEILAVIETSAYPGSYLVDGGNHVHDLTTEERTGIVSYIRSLPPAGF